MRNGPEIEGFEDRVVQFPATRRKLLSMAAFLVIACGTSRDRIAQPRAGIMLKPNDKIALLTSGGDAPGMNSGLLAAAKVGFALGLEVVAVEEGYQGLIEGRIVPVDRAALEAATRRGGTLIGSARSKRFMTPEGQEEAKAQIIRHRLKGLIVFGGNGSLTGAHALRNATAYDGGPFGIVGIPASIDNDLGCTSMAIGVDTAMNTIVEACDRIADTAYSHQRTFIVEVMGRDCGYLAMTTGIAAGADAVLFREGKKTDQELVDQVLRAIDAAYERPSGKKFVLVIQSEGVKLASHTLKEQIDAALKNRNQTIDTRVTVLGHVVRGGAPSAFDRLLASRFANVAVRALVQGQTQVMTGWMMPGQTKPACPFDPYIALWPLEEVLRETANMHVADSPLVQWRIAALAEAEKVLCF
jgi:6-phosphofructokinase 1